MDAYACGACISLDARSHLFWLDEITIHQKALIYKTTSNHIGVAGSPLAPHGLAAGQNCHCCPGSRDTRVE